MPIGEAAGREALSVQETPAAAREVQRILALIKRNTARRNGCNSMANRMNGTHECNYIEFLVQSIRGQKSGRLNPTNQKGQRSSQFSSLRHLLTLVAGSQAAHHARWELCQAEVRVRGQPNQRSQLFRRVHLSISLLHRNVVTNATSAPPTLSLAS